MLKKYSLFIIIFSLFLNTGTALAGYPKTDADYLLLPPFCKARASDSKSANYKKWARKLGPDFIHTHHYCAALHSLRLAKSMFPKNKAQKQDKRGMLTFVFNNLKYMEDHAKSTYSLFPHIYTTKAEAYLEARQNSRAIGYFNKAITANNKFTKPYALLSDHYRGLNKKEAARKILEKGLESSPNSRALNNRLKKLSK